MMHIRKHIYLLVLLVLAGCIKPYEPELKDDSVQKYIVQGMVSSVEGFQEVNVSLTSPVNQPEYIGVSGCQVEIIDDQNQKFILQEYSGGKYKVWMDQDVLIPGRSYKVVVHTPDGEIIESAYDLMTSGPDIGDVYYEIKEIPTNDPGIVELGIQFYTNLSAQDDDSRFYNWKLNETWEYHSTYPIEFYYDGEVQHVSPPDYSHMYCWTSIDVDEIYTLSTQNLSDNSFTRFPLNFVKNNTTRLGVLYSLLVHQTSLTQNAFTYWDQLRQNSEQDGGLYSSQPIAIKGNLRNITYPEKHVLGYFQASTFKIKRIFVYPVEDLPLIFSDFCNPMFLRNGLREIDPNDYPAYLMTEYGNWKPILLNNECVECEIRGGTTTKPNYWPEK